MDIDNFDMLLQVLKLGVTIKTVESPDNITKALLDKGYWEIPRRPIAVTTDGAKPIVIKDNDYHPTGKGIRIRDELRDPLQKLLVIRKLREEFDVK